MELTLGGLLVMVWATLAMRRVFWILGEISDGVRAAREKVESARQAVLKEREEESG